MAEHRVVIAGGNGFLGQHLVAAWLAAGFRVDVLTRSPNARRLGNQVVWNAVSVGDWARALEDAEAVVNLTGKSVDCRYTSANRREIIESRLRSVEALGSAVAACAAPPRVWVQASSLAIYGSPGDRVCDETAPLGTGFSPEVCERWESTFDRHRCPRTRPVVLRLGLVFSPSGGALRKLLHLARLGLGGTAGSGNQYISWLHVDDFERVVRYAMNNDEVNGIYNVTSPQPLTNAAFMAALRSVIGRPHAPRVPSRLVRVGAWLMRTEPELALGGRRCIPGRLSSEGFEFSFPQVDKALSNLLNQPIPLR